LTQNIQDFFSSSTSTEDESDSGKEEQTSLILDIPPQLLLSPQVTSSSQVESIEDMSNELTTALKNLADLINNQSQGPIPIPTFSGNDSSDIFEKAIDLAIKSEIGYKTTYNNTLVIPVQSIPQHFGIPFPAVPVVNNQPDINATLLELTK
ncbi:5931_t:CDS:2, partial [Ambispora leptoticha]